MSEITLDHTITSLLGQAFTRLYRWTMSDIEMMQSKIVDFPASQSDGELHLLPHDLTWLCDM